MTTPRGRHARSDDDVVSPAPVIRLNTESFRVPTGADFIAISHGAPVAASWPPPTHSGESASATAPADAEPAELFRRKVHSHRASAPEVPHRPVPPVPEPRVERRTVTEPPAEDERPLPAPHRRAPSGHHRRSRPAATFLNLWRLPSGTEPHLLRPTAQRQLTSWVIATFLCCVTLGIGLALLIHGLADGSGPGVHTGCLLSSVALCLFFCANAFLRPGDVLR